MSSSSMNRSAVIFAGVIATVTASFVGLVAFPDWQLRSLEPVTLENGETRPVRLDGAAARGQQVYNELGCVYCHSQQVRPPGFGADIERGWGSRQTLPRDYIFEQTQLLGTMRTGPDLANIGVRQPSREWHMLHLYDPQITSPGSTMPPFPFLFDRVPRSARPVGALELPEGWGDGEQVIVPKRRAEDLVEYLLSLDRRYPIDGGP